MTRPADAVSGTGWWRNAVIYQVYPRSFADGDGDGVGDLAGLLGRLPYIASLGVDGIWLTPFQPSPQVDQGYDVSDYCGVEPLFGTLAQFDDLLEAAHTLGLRVILDVVPNHCSSEHPLFRAAVTAAPGSPERAMFHVEDGLDGGPPNNWRSVFGGAAWSRIDPASEADRQWYLHLFSAEQSDWNWRNPAVGDYFEGVLRFWFDRGVDGLRIDVAHALFKAEGLPDAERPEDVVDGLRSNPQVSDHEEVHDVYRRWRRLADSYSPARVLVGEVNLEPQRAARYIRPDEMHQAFAFAFATLGWDAAAWARIGTELDAARREHGAPPTWALENHDLVRTATRFAFTPSDDGGRGVLRARAGLLAVLGLPGSAYVYQGQELNLPEVEVLPAARMDPMWTRSGVSRDGARVPLPWTVSPDNTFGFSPAYAGDPWLPTPPGWGATSVEAQERNVDSTLHLVRAALDLRRSLHEEGVLSSYDGGTWRAEDNGLLVCERGEQFLVAVAMGDTPANLPDGDVLIASSALTPEGLLPPDASAWVRRV
ncbi:alpha-amylase family glycosyl hydrolase [Arthrobacter echini]|uniref:alpha-amylase family glycosyl hydrolase n=1 Tax=Arthrobacter echini TaxID=1529066 RepID=UPI001CA33FFD|nr:alpha-amylase family glycosyl hydrolase [Arthrobacter echini]